MPVCVKYLVGKCSGCIFSHVRVDKDAPVCVDFARGYCSLGKKCTKKHIWEKVAKEPLKYSNKGMSLKIGARSGPKLFKILTWSKDFNTGKNSGKNISINENPEFLNEDLDQFLPSVLRKS